MSAATQPTVIGMGSSEHDHRVKFHRHPGTEFIYVNKGRCVTVVEGSDEKLEGRPGWLYVIPRGASHDQDRPELSRTTYVVARIDGRVGRAFPRLLYVGPDSHEARWLLDIYDLGGAHGDAASATRNALMHAVVERLRMRVANAESGERVPQAVATAISFLRDNVREDVAVDDVARAVNLSPSRAAAVFKKHCGCGIVAYQQGLRMEMARTLLQDPYMRVSEAANACGYADVNYFIRLFRKRNGLSPNEWRKERVLGG